MLLLDTNVISEARKGRHANIGVLDLFEEHEHRLYIPVQVVGEIHQGVEKVRARGDEPQAAVLETWLNELVDLYADYILAFDNDCAQVWGRLMSATPQHAVDKQIAAIALVYNMTVVTRNVEDFTGTGVAVLNPFHS